MTMVLVAEDDEDIRDLVVFKLEQSGFDVLATGDGSEALLAAKAYLPDVAVLDITMPGLSGLDVCRLLRQDPATKRMLVIMLTARAQEGDVDTGFATGADDYLVKPFSPRELLVRVAQLLARAPRGP